MITTGLILYWQTLVWSQQKYLLNHFISHFKTYHLCFNDSDEIIRKTKSFSFVHFMISVWQMVWCSKKNHSWNPDIKMQELSTTIHILFDRWKNSYNSCWFHTETPTSHNSVHHVISGSSKSLSLCTGLLVLEIFIWTGSDLDAKVF